MQRLKCYCGGIDKDHFIGDPKCYRTECIGEEEPILLPEDYLGKPMYMIGGDLVTECTLKEQRIYAQHKDGRWSRLKIKNSFNSLDA